MRHLPAGSRTAAGRPPGRRLRSSGSCTASQCGRVAQVTAKFLERTLLSASVLTAPLVNMKTRGQARKICCSGWRSVFRPGHRASTVGVVVPCTPSLRDRTTLLFAGHTGFREAIPSCLCSRTLLFEEDREGGCRRHKLPLDTANVCAVFKVFYSQGNLLL